MNPWPFVIAAYAVAIGATAALLLWAFASMRRAEAAADALNAPMKPKNQRLVLVAAAIVARARRGAAGDVGPQGSRRLFLHARPTSPRARRARVRAIRLGGMVERGLDRSASRTA